MVIILDGILEHVAHAWKNIGLLKKTKILFVTNIDLTKSLNQIK